MLSKHLHSLVLGRTTMTKLRNIDKEVRKALRGWLNLPKDVPLAYFYASIPSGGLGIMCLAESVPMIRKSRLEKFLVSGTTAADTINNSHYVNDQLRWCQKALSHIGENVDKGMRLRHWEGLLDSKYDVIATTRRLYS